MQRKKYGKIKKDFIREKEKNMNRRIALLSEAAAAVLIYWGLSLRIRNGFLVLFPVEKDFPWIVRQLCGLGETAVVLLIAFSAAILFLRLFGRLGRFHYVPVRKEQPEKIAIAILDFTGIALFIYGGVVLYAIRMHVQATDPFLISGMVRSLITDAVILSVAEEIFFRGFILHMLLSGGREFALVWSTVLFALAQGNPVHVVAGLVMGYLLGRMALYYEGIRYGVWCRIAAEAVACILSWVLLLL